MIIEIILLLVLVWLLIRVSRRPSNFPPGPRGLPLIGSIPLLSKRSIHKVFKTMSETYGPVMGFYLGPNQPVISACGYEAVKEASHNDDLNGRIDNALIRGRTFGKRLGFIFTDGEYWQVQRRFTLRQLRDLGFGKTSAEALIQEEIHDLVDDIQSQSSSSEDGSVDFQGMFNLSLLNVLWAVIGGERFKHDDPKLKKLIDAVLLFFRSGANPARSSIPIPGFLFRLFPSLKKFIGIRIELFKPIQDFIRESIEQHERDQSGEEPRDFIDVYLREMENQQKENPENSSFQKEQLIGGIMDLFLAGTETTSSSIGFLLLYLINHPEVQQKLQKELDQVCGDSLPMLAHRPSLVYTEAVLQEVQRCSTIIPNAVPHRAMKDTQLQGYFIPEGSIVFLNLYSIHMDEKYWTDPEIFRPERHLSEDGTKLLKMDHVMPFGAGKRMCLGEALARNTYFLFSAALLKTFEFKGVPNQPLPTTEPNAALTNNYQGFRAVVTLHQ